MTDCVNPSFHWRRTPKKRAAAFEEKVMTTMMMKGASGCQVQRLGHSPNCHFSSTCMFSSHVPLHGTNKLYCEEASAVRIDSSSGAGSCVCVRIQLGAAMSSAELLELPVEPKEERLYFGGRLETRRRPRTASRLTLRDGRARTLALERPGETFRSTDDILLGPNRKVRVF